MAYTAWAATTAFSVGDICRATTQTGFGLVFRCIVAGTSGSTEPAWPTKTYKTSSDASLEGYVVDGTVTWAAISAVSEELQKLAPSAIIELFKLELISGLHYDPANPPATTTYYFHAGTNELLANITWNGQAYTRFPVEAEGFEYSGTGQLPRPTLRVANLNGLLTLALMDVNAYTPGNDLINAKVSRIRTLKKYLDAVNFTGSTNPTADPYAEFPREVYFISRKVSENRNQIEWELASIFDMQGVRAPKRQAIQRCQWIYKSAECSYTPVSNFSGTLSRSGTTVTVTATAHGLSVNDAVFLNLDYLTPINAYGAVFTVLTVPTANSFTITVPSSFTSSSGSVIGTQWFDSNDEPTFTEANDICPKRLTSCEARFGTNQPLPFGGFPGVGQFT